MIMKMLIVWESKELTWLQGFRESDDLQECYNDHKTNQSFKESRKFFGDDGKFDEGSPDIRLLVFGHGIGSQPLERFWQVEFVVDMSVSTVENGLQCFPHFGQTISIKLQSLKRPFNQVMNRDLGNKIEKRLVSLTWWMVIQSNMNE